MEKSAGKYYREVSIPYRKLEKCDLTAFWFLEAPVSIPYRKLEKRHIGVGQKPDIVVSIPYRKLEKYISGECV